jgi:hypothetical protein
MHATASSTVCCMAISIIRPVNGVVALRLSSHCQITRQILKGLDCEENETRSESRVTTMTSTPKPCCTHAWVQGSVHRATESTDLSCSRQCYLLTDNVYLGVVYACTLPGMVGCNQCGPRILQCVTSRGCSLSRLGSEAGRSVESSRLCLTHL